MCSRLRIITPQQYWDRLRNSLNCMILSYGPATFFVSLSLSEYHWEDLYTCLRDTNPNRGKNQKRSLAFLIAADPVNISRFLENKFRAIVC